MEFFDSVEPFKVDITMTAKVWEYNESLTQSNKFFASADVHILMVRTNTPQIRITRSKLSPNDVSITWPRGTGGFKLQAKTGMAQNFVNIAPRSFMTNSLTYEATVPIDTETDRNLLSGRFAVQSSSLPMKFCFRIFFDRP